MNVLHASWQSWQALQGYFHDCYGQKEWCTTNIGLLLGKLQVCAHVPRRAWAVFNKLESSHKQLQLSPASYAYHAWLVQCHCPFLGISCRAAGSKHAAAQHTTVDVQHTQGCGRLIPGL